MARIQPLHPDDAGEALGELLRGLPPLNIIRTVALAESNAGPFLRFGTSILAEQKLPADLRELAILRVARLSRAEYEWVQHVPIGQAAGLSQAHIDALEADDVKAPCFDDRELAVLRFTDDVVANVGSSDVSHADVAAFLSDREVVELVIAIGFYMLVARIMECAQIDLDPPVGAEIIERSASALDKG